MATTIASSGKPERILVIRYGALGDMVYCFQAFCEIRAAHPDAEIALLTAAAFADFARRMPWFDHVMVDPHPSLRQPGRWLGMARDIRAFGPDRIYELHGKLRQAILFALLGGPFGPEWSGAAPFCAYPRLWPPRPGMHFKEFLAAQLRRAGVAAQPPADLSWLDAAIDQLSLPQRYAVLIPSCTPGQDYKRWPAQYYGELARRLLAKGLPVAAVGTRQDAAIISAVKEIAPEVIDLGGRTDLFQLARVLRSCALAVGNDTGPMHLAAALGAPTLALFLASHTNPVWSAPPEPKARWLQGEPLSALSVDEVFLALNGLADKTA